MINSIDRHLGFSNYYQKLDETQKDRMALAIVGLGSLVSSLAVLIPGLWLVRRILI